ncbi:hypothetical protein BJ875DRAFT_517924 [Amylocarpus encephaloides]|uniref:Uncharacterized protein n=1 Tax=Amylocarpus encephaloides TaxID=45428 RepID=A0A9P7YCY2_9HELO|nr:hypothetical protein BJ875DRAFT_517924 [Amylocarpus encephaloides]
MDCYTLTIRVQKKTDELDTPRWHVDKGAFGRDIRFGASVNQEPVKKSGFWRSKAPDKKESKGESTLKIATVLLGPGTLFLPDTTLAASLLSQAQASLPPRDGHTCFPLRCLGCADMATKVRFKLAGMVEERGVEVVQMETGEMVVFGSEGREGREEAAWHSEPRIEWDRVLVHVVPGREGEVRELMRGWGMGFPRCWSVGVDGR